MVKIIFELLMKLSEQQRQFLKIIIGSLLIYFNKNQNIQILIISISIFLLNSNSFGIGLFFSIFIPNLKNYFLKEISIFCIFYLTIGDSISNLIGNSIGKKREFKILIFERNGKSFVGTLISFCFLYFFSFFYLFLNSNYENGFFLFCFTILISIIGSFSEIFSPINDNYFIPIFNGIFIQILFNIFNLNFENSTFNSLVNQSCSVNS